VSPVPAVMRIEYFQLIDRIVDLDLAEPRIRVEATVPTTSTIFEGHFPGQPLMPGVLLIEAMAQTAGWLVIARTRFERMPFLVAVREAKFRRFVLPGEVLALEAVLEHEGSGYAVTQASASIAGKPVTEAELRFRIMAFPDPAFRAGMHEAAARIAFPMEALAND
jgi:3-hydroxyacyl-[acyl-carrier-protein] dehydratase